MNAMDYTQAPRTGKQKESQAAHLLPKKQISALTWDFALLSLIEIEYSDELPLAGRTLQPHTGSSGS